MPVLKLKRFRYRNSEAKERGQSMVEFVLVLPIFLLLVFSIVDFGMGFHAWLTVTNSAREGARLGAVRGSNAEIVTRVHNTADTLDAADMTVTVTNAQGNPGESVVVDVDYDYTLITPLDNILKMISGGTVGPTITLSSTADMRLE
ncbi:MAG TPA: TadE/TadG family type IV pilus assembly protein [Dehalococcoidia bacterium]|nr:TadE/TadG family type IV pilus assembly protein [Dehalococcoidia bacterium]